MEQTEVHPPNNSQSETESQTQSLSQFQSQNTESRTQENIGLTRSNESREQTFQNSSMEVNKVYKRLPMEKIARSFHQIWSTPLSRSYVARDFSRLANKFSVEMETEAEIDNQTAAPGTVEGMITNPPSHAKATNQDIQAVTDILVPPISIISNSTDNLNHLKYASSSHDLLDTYTQEEEEEETPPTNISDESFNEPQPPISQTDKEIEYQKLLFRQSSTWNALGFRREEEKDQSLIIVEDLNVLSELLNNDLLDDDDVNEENTRKAEIEERPHRITESLGHDDMWKFMEPLIDIEAFNKRVYTLSDSKPLCAFLLDTFHEETSRTIKILKCCDQAFVVCLLGHLGMILFSEANIRFKDIRPSTWRVIVRKHKNTYSVIHRRTEQSLKLDSNSRIKFIELCKFTWEVEIVFDSKLLNYIDSIHARILKIDWPDCEHQDLEHEKYIQKAFEDCSITNLKLHLEPPVEKVKSTPVNQSSTKVQHNTTQKKSGNLFGCMMIG